MRVIDMLQHIHQQDGIEAARTERIGLGQIADHIHFGVWVDIQGQVAPAFQQRGKIASPGPYIQDQCLGRQGSELSCKKRQFACRQGVPVSGPRSSLSEG